ncbi:hypothetical protein ACFQZQ_02925 [Lysobacter koreensis]|uniref:Tail fiber domain-containing protein n=2 Tax=Lysobacter koreensis TaxID=266122 RepID=A0ABW2YP66_9GAMM
MAVVSWGALTAGDATLSDNAGNTWVKVGSALGPSTGGSGGYNCRGVIYKCESCTGHASFVLTATRSGEYPSVAYQEYKGTGITVEAFASANDAATPFSSGNVGTPAANGAGLFGAWIHNAASGGPALGVNSPMTVVEAVTDVAQYYPVALAAGLQATAAAFSADFTTTDTVGGTAVFGAFLKESSGPAAYTLPADSGSYALTGSAASLLHGRSQAADSGSYTLTGTDASLRVDRVLAAASGSYALAGSDATLVYATSGSYTLTAEPGSYVLTGSDALLMYSGSAEVLPTPAGDGGGPRKRRRYQVEWKGEVVEFDNQADALAYLAGLNVEAAASKPAKKAATKAEPARFDLEPDVPNLVLPPVLRRIRKVAPAARVEYDDLEDLLTILMVA